MFSDDTETIWPQVQIGDVATAIMGQAPEGSSYNTAGQGLPLIAGAADLRDVHPSPTKWTTQPSQLAQRGDLIICIRATVGVMNWADRDYCLGRGVAALRIDNDLVEPEFLYHWLLTRQEDLMRMGTGSTFLQIRRQDLEEFPLMLPPLLEQQRIVAILRQADELCRLRREADERIRALLPALFEEMFGNCNPSNELPDGWVPKVFGDLVVDMQYGISSNMSDAGDIPILRMNNITADGQVDLSDLKYLPRNKVNLSTQLLEKGDVLFNRTNSIEHVGKTGIWRQEVGEYTFASYIIRVKAHQSVGGNFIWAFLNSAYGKYQLGKLAKQAFATVQKIRSPLRAPDLASLAGESTLARACLHGGHIGARGGRFETDSGHTDRCDETAPASLGLGQTPPRHAPTHRPNS